MKQKYLWYTDTHLDKIAPWTKISFIRRIVKEKPQGVFLTGDISNGLLLKFDLALLAKMVDCPIYFVLGNHDYHFSSFDNIHDTVKELCYKYPNLIWMSDSDIVPLTNQVALIGTEGWYDARIGEPAYLKATLDWMLIKDFKDLPSMSDRIKGFRALAQKSADFISDKLEKCLEQGYKNIYLLTHFPPWKEATRDVGTLMEKFWLPYNVNLTLGTTIEGSMVNYPKRHLTVLSGHTHTDAWIHVSRNIECKVNSAKYYKFIRNEEHIFI